MTQFYDKTRGCDKAGRTVGLNKQNLVESWMGEKKITTPGAKVAYYNNHAFIGGSIGTTDQDFATALSDLTALAPYADPVRASLGHIWSYAAMAGPSKPVFIKSLQGGLLKTTWQNANLGENGDEDLNIIFPSEPFVFDNYVKNEAGQPTVLKRPTLLIPAGYEASPEFDIFETPEYIKTFAGDPFTQYDANALSLFHKETILLSTNKNILKGSTGPAQANPNNIPVTFGGSAFQRILDRINADNAANTSIKEDNLFQYTLPYYKTGEQDDRFRGQMFVETEAKYNYFIDYYENTIAKEITSEAMMPSVLVALMETKNSTTEFPSVWGPQLQFGPNSIIEGAYGSDVGGGMTPSQKATLHNFLTLDGIIKEVYIDILSEFKPGGSHKTGHGGLPGQSVVGNTNLGFKAGENDVGQYFRKWSEAVNAYDGVLQEVVQGFAGAKGPNIPFINAVWNTQIIHPIWYPGELPGYWDAAAGKKNLFPMYNRLTFKTDWDSVNMSEMLGWGSSKFDVSGGKGSGNLPPGKWPGNGKKDKFLVEYLQKNQVLYPLIKSVAGLTDAELDQSGIGDETLPLWWGPFEGQALDSFNDGTKAVETRALTEIKMLTTFQEQGQPWDQAWLPWFGDRYVSYSGDPAAKLPNLKNDLVGEIVPTMPLLSRHNASNLHDTHPEEYTADGSPIFGKVDFHPLAVEMTRHQGPNVTGDEGYYAACRRSAEIRVTGRLAKSDKVPNYDFEEMIAKKTRTFKEIMCGQKACTEIVFWRIQKWHAPNGTIDTDARHIQDFYIPNGPGSPVIDFIDTQVKYNKKYIYRIYAWTAVFGTEYKFNFPKAFDIENYQEAVAIEFDPEAQGAGPMGVPGQAGPGGGMDPGVDPNQPPPSPIDYSAALADVTLDHPFQFTTYGKYSSYDTVPMACDKNRLPSAVTGISHMMALEVETRPNLKLIEVPHFEVDPVLLIQDKPPMTPTAQPVPYKNRNNIFLINLFNSTGRSTEVPIALQLDDQAKILDQYITQGLIDQVSPIERPNIPLEYESDDPPALFEVFRLDSQPSGRTMPEIYSQFTTPDKYLEIPADGGTSVSLKDIVKPNNKYYYTFRVRDVHNNISNPTPIYEIELVDNDGAIYMVTNLYEPEPLQRSSEKQMRRFLHVIPSQEQVELNLEESGLVVEQRGIPESVASTASGKGKKLSLGVAAESTLDNKKVFKIRLTSKNSGKKIDINLNFEHKRNVTQEEENAHKYAHNIPGPPGPSAQVQLQETPLDQDAVEDPFDGQPATTGPTDTFDFDG